MHGRVYFSMDLDVHHGDDGKAEVRGMILVQHPPQDPDSDCTEWFPLVGDGARDKPKPRTVVASEFRSTGVYVEQPWLGWREDLRKAKAVVVDTATAQLAGMSRMDRALVPEAEGAKATLSCPAASEFHLGLVFRDSGVGDEELSVRAAGKPVAKCVLAQNEGVLALFVTKEPVTLARGDPIELIAAAPVAQDFWIVLGIPGSCTDLCRPYRAVGAS